MFGVEQRAGKKKKKIKGSALQRPLSKKKKTSLRRAGERRARKGEQRHAFSSGSLARERQEASALSLSLSRTIIIVVSLPPKWRTTTSSTSSAKARSARLGCLFSILSFSSSSSSSLPFAASTDASFPPLSRRARALQSHGSLRRA